MTDPVGVLVVSGAACHLCEDARRALSELASDYPIDVRIVDATSCEGRDVVALHRPSMLPVVLVDGRLFSVGRLPVRKLRKQLDGMAAA